MKKVYIITILLFIAGCQTTYKAMNVWDGLGYTDKKISAGVYEITYLVNASTAKEKAVEFWHQRAKELCGNGKYSHDVKLTHKVNFNSSGVNSSTHHFPLATGVVRCNN
jgi:hypothetical protein